MAQCREPCSVAQWQSLDAKLAKEKDITAVKAGLLVNSVTDRSTAKELGLQEDDVITAINDTDVHNFAQLVEQTQQIPSGRQDLRHLLPQEPETGEIRYPSQHPRQHHHHYERRLL